MNPCHKIVVTVDLLTTGIDVPEITAVVFVRRVKSRILYEQMLGRATRLCPDLFGEGEDKEVFEIFDAVDLYGALEDFSTMKPVVKNARATISQLKVWIKEALGKEDQTSAEAFQAELVVKVRRLTSKIKTRSDELSTRFPTLTPESLLEQIADSPASALAVLDSYSELADWLQKLHRKTGARRLLVSEHKDQVIDVSRGYGDGREKPEDYLSRFNQWIDENRSEHKALKLVLTAPASLTRKSLKELVLAMDDAGFNETQLQPAWREVKHENCAARLIGYIRAQALGSLLISFEERVEQAAERVMANTDFQWTQNQQRWLDRIVKQIKSEVIVDHESLKSGAFASAGGFNTINKSFSGKLDLLLETLHQEIWQDPAA